MEGRFTMSRFAQLILSENGRYRFDFFFAFLAFFFGIIFFTAFFAVLATDFAAETTRLVIDFFFDFLAMLPPFGFLCGLLGAFRFGFLPLVR